MSKDNVTRFPIKSDERWRNRMGQRAVPCFVTDRWLQFPERSDSVNNGHYMFVDVMTRPDGENTRKLTTLCISKEDLAAALEKVK